MINLDPTKWLCYPAMVGSLLILVYFSTDEFELNFALCNLFELAVGPELQRKPDAMMRARQRVHELLGAYQPPSMPEEQMTELSQMTLRLAQQAGMDHLPSHE